MVAKYSGKLRVERDGVTSALLVLNNTTGEGILVNSEGSAYARYSAYLPFAKPYLDYYELDAYIRSDGTAPISDEVKSKIDKMHEATAHKRMLPAHYTR